MKLKIIVWVCMLCALELLSACSSGSDVSQIGRNTINVVEVLRLDQAVRLEIMEFDLEDANPEEDYLPVADISSQDEVEEIIFLLDQDLEETPALLCIPEYQLRFWMEDGTQVDLGFSCQDARFLTGDQWIFDGRQFAPPAKFTGLIESYLPHSAAAPETINLLKAAEFGDVVQVEVIKDSIPEASAVFLISQIDDIEVIEEILLALSGDFQLYPRERCHTIYILSFSMADGRTITFRYMCDGNDNGILRGDQDYFFDQDIHLGEEFVELFDRLVNP